MSLMDPRAFRWLLLALASAGPAIAAPTASNPNCPVETVFFQPGNGEDIAFEGNYP